MSIALRPGNRSNSAPGVTFSIKQWIKSHGQRMERQLVEWRQGHKKTRNFTQTLPIENRVTNGQNGVVALSNHSPTPSPPPSSCPPPKILQANRGLVNYGNTCYCNSVIQALFHCDEFRNRFLAKHTSRINSRRRSSLKTPLIPSVNPTSALIHHLGQLFLSLAKPVNEEKANGKKNTAVKPKKFIHELQGKNGLFGGLMQHDAHEFLHFIINACEDSLRGEMSSSDENCMIDELFSGTLVNETTCLQCRSSNFKEEKFLDLSLDVQSRESQGPGDSLRLENNRSIEQCLSEFSEPEKLEGDQMYFCEKCSTKCEATKRMLINQCPEILILHLKRFKCERIDSLTYKKICSRVPFPVDLCLNSTKYRLRSFIVHCGAELQRGHYLTVVRNDDGSADSVKWATFDDDVVGTVANGKFEEFYGVADSLDEPDPVETDPVPCVMNAGAVNIVNSSPAIKAASIGRKRVFTGYILFYEKESDQTEN